MSHLLRVSSLRDHRELLSGCDCVTVLNHFFLINHFSQLILDQDILRSFTVRLRDGLIHHEPLISPYELVHKLRLFF